MFDTASKGQKLGIKLETGLGQVKLTGNWILVVADCKVFVNLAAVKAGEGSTVVPGVGCQVALL